MVYGVCTIFEFDFLSDNNQLDREKSGTSSTHTFSLFSILRSILMLGMKRPYALSVDNPAGPSFNGRPPMAAPMRSDESASCSYIGLYSYPFFGEGPSCSSSSSEPNSRKKMKGNAFRGDLLTLATPTTTWMCQNSKLKHLSAHAVDSNNEFTDLVSLPLRGVMEIHPEPSWSNGFQPYYRFFPPALAQSGQTSPKTSGRFNVEDESVDLNLKL